MSFIKIARLRKIMVFIGIAVLGVSIANAAV